MENLEETTAEREARAKSTLGAAHVSAWILGHYQDL